MSEDAKMTILFCIVLALVIVNFGIGRMKETRRNG